MKRPRPSAVEKIQAKQADAVANAASAPASAEPEQVPTAKVDLRLIEALIFGARVGLRYLGGPDFEQVAGAIATCERGMRPPPTEPAKA